MKSRRLIKRTCCTLVWAVLALSFLGCMGLLSWSPDGRYLAFVGPDDGDLWLWDTKTQEAKKVFDGEEAVAVCQYFPVGKFILVGTEDSGEHVDLLKLDVDTGAVKPLAEEVPLGGYDISADGQYLYYVKDEDELWEKRLWHPDHERLVFSSEKDLMFPRVDGGRRRILLFSEEGICVLDVKKGTAHTVVRGSNDVDKYYMLPTWVDNDRFVYIDVRDDDEPGALYVYSFMDSAARKLCGDVYWVTPVSLSPDRRTIFFSTLRRDLLMDGEAESPWVWQAASVDITTGKVSVLTDAPFGAICATRAPKGNRMAYRTGMEDGTDTVRILDLDTKRTTVVWRDTEEKLIGEAVRLAQDGNPQEAVGTYRELLARFPETRFREIAWYEIMTLYLKPPLCDLDQGFSAFARLREDALREQARRLFWREEDRVASDPEEDWITKYGTNESQKEFDFDTDLTRDLVGLWARWGAEWLYLRIDYNSSRDLEGLTFQDTLLLFDLDTPEDGYRSISPSTEWDRGAERQVVFRHWSDQGSMSQYDVEIRNDKGEVLSRFVASGFEKGAYPYVEVVDMVRITSEPSSIVFSLSREPLGLQDARKVHLQVCTFKGGIEQDKKKERLRESVRDGRPVCDVADAFGIENTAERLQADFDAGKLPVIRGYAAVLEPPSAKPEEE